MTREILKMWRRSRGWERSEIRGWVDRALRMRRRRDGKKR